LIQIARFVQENSSRPVIVQVASQLAKIVREKLERDKRYVRAVKAKEAQPAQSKREQRIAYAERKAEEVAAEKSGRRS
jgi:hypothetical protein